MASQLQKRKTLKIQLLHQYLPIQQQGRFLSIAQELRDKEKERKASGKKAEGDEKGIQVLINADVKYTLDELKSKGIHIPTKHLLTAAVKVFLENNAKEVNKILGKRRKI